MTSKTDDRTQHTQGPTVGGTPFVLEHEIALETARHLAALGVVPGSVMQWPEREIPRFLIWPAFPSDLTKMQHDLTRMRHER